MNEPGNSTRYFGAFQGQLRDIQPGGSYSSESCLQRTPTRYTACGVPVTRQERSRAIYAFGVNEMRAALVEVVYCDNCSVKIAEDAFSSGTAVHADDGKIYCARCAPLFKFTTTSLQRFQPPTQASGDETTGEYPPVMPSSTATKFYFCETCGKRITDKQILEGLGRDKKLKGVFCKDCAVGVMTMEFEAIKEVSGKTPPQSSAKPPTPVSGAKSSGAKSSAVNLAVATRPAAKSNDRPSIRVHGGQSTKIGNKQAVPTSVILGTIAGVVILCALVLLLSSSSSEKSRTANKSVDPFPVQGTPPPPPSTASEESNKRLLPNKSAREPIASAAQDPMRENSAEANGRKSVSPTESPASDPASHVATELPAAPNTEYLTDMTETEVRVGYGKFGKHGELGYGEHLRVKVNGIDSPHGLSMAPHIRTASHVTYALNRKFKTFRASAALNDSGNGFAGQLIFKVRGDGKELWVSKPIQNVKQPQEVRLDVNEISKLELEVECKESMGGGHAVWFEPNVERK